MACAEICRAMSDGDRRVLRGRRVRAHLRDCPGCAAFASSIEARQSELRALVPVLPAAVSAAVLSRAMEAGVGGAGAGAVAGSGGALTGSGGAAAGSGGAGAAGAAGKTIGLAFGTKGFATASLLATAAVSVSGVAAVVRLAPNSGRVVHARPARSVQAGPSGHTAASATRAATPVLGSVRSTYTRAAASRHVRFTPARSQAPAAAVAPSSIRPRVTRSRWQRLGPPPRARGVHGRAGSSSGGNKSEAGRATSAAAEKDLTFAGRAR